MKSSHNILIVKHEEKRPLGSPRRRWKDSGFYGNMMWTGFVWFTIGSCEHCNEPSGSTDLYAWEVLRQLTISFLRRTLFHGVS
jgi:hypothetical protein